MNPRTLSVIALSNRDYGSLSEKLSEAVRWVELAAAQGAELIVLPENLHLYSGDGRPADHRKGGILEDERKMAPLFEAAQRLNVYLTIPAVRRREEGVVNSMVLISPKGEEVWRYDKRNPTPEEIAYGIMPGRREGCFDWRGVKVGGMICFDSCFPENMERLAAQKVQLVLFPSLWPGGAQLNTFCKIYSVRMAVAYPAWSRIIDVDGREVVAGGYRQESLRFGFGAPVYTTTLNFDRVTLFGNGNQEKITALLAKYGKKVRVELDQDNCLWYLDSLCEDLSEADLLREFELTPATDYFARCREAIHATGGTQ